MAPGETSSSPSPQQELLKPRHQRRIRFWNNLSHVWLTAHALQEVDRRTVWPVAPVQPNQSGNIDKKGPKLKRFARRGGPDLEDLRAFREPGEGGTRKRLRSWEESDEYPHRPLKKLAYDQNFGQHLANRGVYQKIRLQKPSNLSQIKKRIAESRRSLSPSRFVEDEGQIDQATRSISNLMNLAFKDIPQVIQAPFQNNMSFRNFEDLASDTLYKSKPDFFEGSLLIDLDQKIQEQLRHHIVPITNPAIVCLPNFLEGKGLPRDDAVALRQASYDGALGARGIHELRSYIDEKTAYDRNAYTIASTYQYGVLTIYAIHPIPPRGSSTSLRYQVTKVGRWDLTRTFDNFRKGVKALRNARDWAKEQRMMFIAAANSRVVAAED